jgi:hypothetical protein
VILRQYPTQGQEITMTEGVWKDSKATGKLEGNKLVVDTTMPTGMKWHDEWTLAEDGKTYSALRQMVSAGNRGASEAARAAERRVAAAVRKHSPRFSNQGAGVTGMPPLIWRAARTSPAYAVMASGVIRATFA